MTKWLWHRGHQQDRTSGAVRTGTGLGAVLSLCLSLISGAWVFLPSGDAQAQRMATCRQPQAICDVRRAVFPVVAVEKVFSAVRIGPDVLVTNRHNLADEPMVGIASPDGQFLQGQPVATAYEGDLVLIYVEGLPKGWPILSYRRPGSEEGLVYAIGAEYTGRTVRSYEGGEILVPLAEGERLARYQTSAASRKSNEGGALVDEDGKLLGIIVKAGHGATDAIPVKAISRLYAKSGNDFAEKSAEMGAAYRICSTLMERFEADIHLMSFDQGEAMLKACKTTNNRDYLERAGTLMGQVGEYERAVNLLKAAVAQDSEAVEPRIGLVRAYHDAGQFQNEFPHLEWLLGVIPWNFEVLRLSIQAGKWGGNMDLAEAAYSLLVEYHPDSAENARDFIDGISSDEDNDIGAEEEAVPQTAPVQ
ncbi:trypsin-like peptidase domain-containing protein [Rhodovibrionaceae bacterium A322]